MNQNERIAQLEETIRLKDQEIYDVKTSVAEVLEEIHELNEKNEDEVLKKTNCRIMYQYKIRTSN